VATAREAGAYLTAERWLRHRLSQLFTLAEINDYRSQKLKSQNPLRSAVQGAQFAS
jgi:hypothetical protein